MTYIILNIVFLVLIVGGLLVAKKLRWNRAMTWTMSILLITTLVFDSIIVGAGIVAYDESKIIGMRLGQAPIEDFFYAILAGLVIPIVWQWKEKDYGKN